MSALSSQFPILCNNYKQYGVQKALLFAFQFKKPIIEAKCGTVSYRTCKKKQYQRFKTRNVNLEDNDHSDASRKFDNNELEELFNENPTQT